MHFCLLLVTDQQPTEASIEQLLAPHHDKWDWHQVGGRWTGMLAPEYEPEKDPANIEQCSLCGGTGRRNDELGRSARMKNPLYTCNGCDGKGRQVKWPTSWAKFPGDSRQKSALDIPAARAAARTKALALYDEAAQIIAGRTVPEWPEYDFKSLEDSTVNRKITAFWDSAVVKKLRANERFAMWGATALSDFGMSRAEYGAAAEAACFQPCVLLQQNVWLEGFPSKQWAETLDALPGDAWLTVIDIHN